MKAEEFIKAKTRIGSNTIKGVRSKGVSIPSYSLPWLTPENARQAVEIAREETLQEVKSKLLYMLNTSIDNKHFFEQLDDYIEELKTSNER